MRGCLRAETVPFFPRVEAAGASVSGGGAVGGLLCILASRISGSRTDGQNGCGCRRVSSEAFLASRRHPVLDDRRVSRGRDPADFLRMDVLQTWALV